MGRDEFGIYADVGVPDTQAVFRMRRIEPGTFLMGSPDDDPEATDRERPQHEVTLSEGFWLADAPCTQSVYEAVMGKNPSRFKGDDRPVEQVSWDDTQAFIHALNDRLAGVPFSLPSEAQWEYACRAGTTTARYEELDAIAWHHGNADGQTHAVRQKQPNAWGLYDMLGNAREWCFDTAKGWGALFGYPHGPRTDPVTVGHPEHSSRVVRGGSWSFDAQYVRAAYRYASSREHRNVDLGFRLARGRAAEP